MAGFSLTALAVLSSASEAAPLLRRLLSERAPEMSVTKSGNLTVTPFEYPYPADANTMGLTCNSKTTLLQSVNNTLLEGETAEGGELGSFLECINDLIFKAEKKEADSSEIMDSKPVSEDSYLDAVFAAPTLQSESSERQLAAPMTSKSGEIPPELGVSSKELIQFGDRTGVMTFSNENMPWLSTWSFAWGIHDGKGGQYLAAAHICSYDCWSSHLEDGSDEAALTNRTGWCKKEDCFAQFGGSKRQNSTALVESVSFFSHLVQPALRAGPQ
uniref:Uncharacterized protein n=1 Tax=Chromera velia CCMP2878 TaxID=1169474 RepID=A0A0K6S934_9ALVE|eukprot:Cvel_6410.t1-p1 / transcript=Cvel_6410.t1 / gene=Cvel_6410 / organism=Chromera_velia_CCMP2878 / gene_product=hypothetical protein / transcript_product=hypothetical protein / location=Cvel_scaffold313:52034-53104(-) / protein_length=271 / sequence_SO=supercontig / SO=protein_coding / is_pseudo=false